MTGRRLCRAPAGLVTVALLLCGCRAALREPPSIEELSREVAVLPAERVEAVRRRAEALFARRTPRAVRESAGLWIDVAVAERNLPESWIGAARAYIWLADHLQDPEMRAEAARSAVHAAQWCERGAPGHPECRYWLAAALGIQARERRTTAIDALPRILKLLEQAAAEDPGLDHGGPYRVMALVYLRAPGWPRGPGDPDLGLEYARKALEIAPAYPPNLLALAEALRATDDRRASRETYALALEAALEWDRRDEPDARDWARDAERRLGRRRGR